MPDTYFYDLEIFSNCFMASFQKRGSEEIKTVTVHPSKATDRLRDLLSLFRSGGFFVGYNSRHFDDPIMHYILKTSFDDRQEFLQKTFDKAQEIINGRGAGKWKYGVPFAQIDLMQVGNLYTKSLKEIAINLKWERIQDFPYDFNHQVQTGELGELQRYNHNDVGITAALFEELKDDINLRLFISREENVEVLDASNQRIADVLLEKKYSKATGVPQHVFKGDQTTYDEPLEMQDIIEDDIEFSHPNLSSLLEEMKEESIMPGDSFKKEVPAGNQLYTVAKGGLHSNHDSEWIKPHRGEKLIDADVGSYYPFLVFRNNFCPAHLSNEFIDILEEITLDRIQDKKEENWTASAAKKIVINCFTPDHEIVTAEGIKNIEDVEKGDLVYSKDPDTGVVELKPVTRTYRQDQYSGPMARMENNYIDLMVTPNHRMMTRQFKGQYAGEYEWKDAEDVVPGKCRHQFPRHEPLEGETRSHIRLSEICKQLGIPYKLDNGMIKYDRQQDQWIRNVYNVGDWMELMGWYLSEGSSRREERKEYEDTVRGASAKIMLSQRGPEQQQITSLLQRMGISFSAGDKDVQIGNELLFRILKDECGQGCENMKIPGWVFRLDGSIAINLWRSLMQGDGHKDGYTYTTKSDRLAEDFQSLTLQCGYNCTYRENDGCHRIGVHHSQGHSPILRSTEREMVDYEGPVVCLEVADNHTVFAGRNSKFNWVGQSVYGKSRDHNSWMHDPMVTYQVTINGQLYLLMLIDRLEQAGFPVVYANTDGVTARVDASREDEYKAICEQWEEQTGFILDYEEFNWFALADVNNFIAEKEGGSMKRKGRFNKNRHVGTWGLGRSFDMPIVPIAIEEYFVNGTPPEKTIAEHDDVLDFCTTQNVGKKFDVVYKTIEDNEMITRECQQTNRWYIAEMGGVLIKKTDSKEQLLESGEHVRLLNTPPTPKDREAVREQYYVEKAYQEIKPIDHQQLSLTI
jgi:DNA polymerase elongation subunit (family B)